MTQTNAATGATTFSNTVSVGSATLRGTAYSVNNSFASTGGGAVAVTNSGVFTKGATGAITAPGGFSTSGNVSLANNITTTNTDLAMGGNLVIAQGASVTLSTQGAPGVGNITVTGTTSGTTGGTAETLTLTAGTGNVNFNGAVSGSATPADATGLTGVTVQSANAVNFADTMDITGALVTGSVTPVTNTNFATAAVANKTFKAGSMLFDSANVTLGNGAIKGNLDTSTANGNITFISDNSVTFNTSTINAGAGAVQLTPHTVANTIEVCSSAGTTSCTGTFDTQYDLTNLTAITAGSFTIGRAIASGDTVNQTGAITMQTLDSSNTSPGFGITLRNAGTGTITVNGNYVATAGQLWLDNQGTGLADLKASITAPGGFKVSGNAQLSAASIAVDTSGAGGNITFSGTLDGTTAGAQGLTLNAGTGGNVFFTGAVGTGGGLPASRLGNVLITNANNVTESAGITAASLTQVAGQGTTTLTGAVDTNTATGVLLTTDAITANNTITTVNNGVVTLTNAGLLTLNGDISADGAVTQNGAGPVSVTGTRAITTTGDAVSFATGVTLANPSSLSIDTASGAAAGNNITFSSTLNGTTAGAQNLTLNAGTGGDVMFTGAVGGTRLGDVTINSARNVTEVAGLTAKSLTQSAGTGTTLLTGAVDMAGSATGVQLTTNAITANNTITTVNSGAVTLTNAGLLTLNGNISADGAVTQNGAGPVSVTGARAITTTGDAVSFATGVTLANPSSLSIDTASGAAAGNNITFSSTLNGTTAGAQNLTLNAGTGGDVMFTGAVGGTRLGDVTINSARNVTEVAGLTAKSLTQSAGTGTTLLTGAVDMAGSATGVQLTTNAITANNTITTVNNGVVTLTNAGLLTLNGDISADGAVTQNGAGPVSVTGTRAITTTADDVNFLRAVTVNGGQLNINTAGTGATTGDITFQSTLTGTTVGAENLDLTAGTSNILFTGVVGATRLGDVTINSARNVTEVAGLTAKSLTQSAGTGTTLLTGAVDMAGSAMGVQLTTNTITANNTITTVNNGVVTLTNAGLLTLNGDISADGAVTQNGAGLVSVTGARAITTTGDAVSFATGVTLANPSSLSIDTASGAAAGNNITFSSTLNGTTAGAQNLTLNAGTGGDVMFTGAVGGTRLGDVTINSARNVTEVAGLTAKSLTQSAGTGTTLLTGAVDMAGSATGVQLTTNAITANNTITTVNSGAVTLTNAGLLTLNGNISADGAVTQNGAGPVSVTGARAITTTGDAVSFATGVTLANPSSLSIDTASGAAAGNNITFSSTLNGTTAGAQNLTLNAGTGGDVMFTGAVGGTRLGDVTINSARNVTEVAGLTAKSLTQSAGTGTTLLTGAVDMAGSATGVQLTTNAITANNTITTVNNGVVTLTNAGLLTLNGDISADGAVTQNGAGPVSVTGTRAITTTADDVNFLRAVTVNGGQLNINTAGTGATTGDITFQSTLTGTTVGAENLDLTAGTSNILFTGVVGATRLGDVTINSARNVTEVAGLTAKSLTQSAGTGTTLLTGAVDMAGSAMGVQLTTNTITANNTITTVNNGVVTLTNAGLLTLNGDISADGAVTQNGAGLVSVTGARAITTTGDAVSFATGVTLANPSSLSIDTTSGAAAGNNITFSSTLNGTTAGAQNLTLNAGTGGDVMFTGAVGTTRLGDISITSANNVTESAGITAASVTQAAGQGTTKLNGAVNTSGANANGEGISLTTTGTITNNALLTNQGTSVTSNGTSIISLAANKMLLGGAITAGTGAVNLTSTTSGNTINLGSTTDAAASTLELSQAEINTITTQGTLTIGSTPSVVNHTGPITTSGNITFNAYTIPGSPPSGPTGASGLVVLQTSGGDINVNNTLTVNTNNLTLDTTSNGTIGGGAIFGTGSSLLNVTNDHNLNLTAGSGIGTLATPLRIDLNNTSTNNAGTLTAANINTTILGVTTPAANEVNIFAPNSGNVMLATNFRNQAPAPGGELRLATFDGNIDTGNAVVQSTTGRIAFIANDAGVGGNIKVGGTGSQHCRRRGWQYNQYWWRHSAARCGYDYDQ